MGARGGGGWFEGKCTGTGGALRMLGAMLSREARWEEWVWKLRRLGGPLRGVER